jgi:SWI/SNF-related matrix-associated actin-dependent regulator 1 of chromatin subfamily A
MPRFPQPPLTEATVARLQEAARDFAQARDSADAERLRWLADVIDIPGDSQLPATRALAFLVLRRYKVRGRLTDRHIANLNAITPGVMLDNELETIENAVIVHRAPVADSFDLVLVSKPLIDEAVKFGARATEQDGRTVYRLHGSVLNTLVGQWRQAGTTIAVTEDIEMLLERRVPRRFAAPSTGLPAWIAGDAVVLQPSDQKEIGIIRAVPGRSYNSTDRTWSVPLIESVQLRENLRAAGVDVANLDALGLERHTGALPLLRVEPKGTSFALSFPFDEALQVAIRGLAGSMYVPADRTWLVPRMELHGVAAILASHPVTYDRSQLDAGLASLPEMREDLPIVVPEVPLAKPYQMEGIRWLTQPLTPLREELGTSLRGFLLGDDRGLGKTMQSAIAANLATPKDLPILVVSPASYLYGWEEEILRWIGPKEKVTVIESRQVVIPHDARWVIVSYNLLDAHYDALRARGFGAIIVDEAHRIKNMLSKRARLLVGHDSRDAAKSIEGIIPSVQGRVYLLSGTPLPNRAVDGYNLWRAIGHPYGHNFYRYARRFSEVTTNEFGTRFEGGIHLDELREGVDPVFLQRHKADVLPELPPKIREFLPVTVPRADFDALVKSYRDEKQQKPAYKKNRNAALLAFYQHARMSTALAKVPATADYARDAIEDGDKVVIFSGSTAVLDKLEEQFGDISVRLDGSKSATQRQRIVRSFNTDPEKKVFLGQWEAAGESISLTAATQCIFNELDWVPKTHMQAEDRIHRIGQDQIVRITYMVARGTLDVELARYLQKKLEMTSTFEGRDEADFDELSEILNERVSIIDKVRSPSLVLQ